MRKRRKRSLLVVALVSMPTAAAVYLLMYCLTDNVPLGILVGSVVGLSINLVMGPR
jgi:ABC-type transporter Mla maintaining outer membrane lipid asymmetry permease subunit MlaE